MLCPKCGNTFFAIQDGTENSCMNCGYYQTTISADVAAEVEKNLTRKRLRAEVVQLPSLPKWMPDDMLLEDDELNIVSARPVRPKRKEGEWVIW